MSLPVLPTPRSRTDADLLRLFCRAELLRSDPLAEQTALPAGTALTNPALPNVPDANRLLDAAIPDGVPAEQAIAQVIAHFANLGLRCQEWWPNPSQPPFHTPLSHPFSHPSHLSSHPSPPLASALQAAGYVPRTIEILALASPAHPPDRQAPAASVYSARAALGHARSLAELMLADSPHPAEAIEAFLLHLDNPHYELLLAAESGTPLGMIGVLSAGDLGRIGPLFVRPDRHRPGLPELLLDRAIELCARSRFADVLASPANPAPFIAAGFRPIGGVTVYAPSPV